MWSCRVGVLGCAGVCLLLMSGCRSGPPKSPEEVAASARNHDGFYMRFASGLGAYNELAMSDDERYGGSVEVRARGFVVANEFALGGTPYPGLVVGGGAFGTEVVTSSVTTTLDDEPDTELADDLEIESRDLTIVGVFFDRYFLPTLGFHVQGALGVAQQYGLSIGPTEVYDPVGPGGVLGLGYEMWVADQWSVGVLARVTGSVLFGKDTLGVRWVHLASSWPCFMMSVTYH